MAGKGLKYPIGYRSTAVRVRAGAFWREPHSAQSTPRRGRRTGERPARVLGGVGSPCRSSEDRHDTALHCAVCERRDAVASLRVT